MAALKVSINDVSLRDGIQSEARYIALDDRLRIVEKLLAAGVKSLQVASFVHPDRVPQMRAIEELIDRLPNKETVAYSALVLNEKGLKRLLDSGLTHVDLSMSCSDTHSRKNTGMSLLASTEAILRMVAAAKAAGLKVRTGLQCVFDCYYEGPTPMGRVLELTHTLARAGVDCLSLADSTGKALPVEVSQLIQAVSEQAAPPLVMHLHDTYGLGMANVIAAYAAGVRSFDASLGGVGGCPFIPGASGNVPIEDLAYYFQRCAVETGLTLEPLRAAGEILETALQSRLPGKIYQLLQTQKARTPQE